MNFIQQFDYVKHQDRLTFSRHITASFKNGQRRAFETKPGTSWDCVTSLPQACEKARARSSVSDVVWSAGTSSTSFYRRSRSVSNCGEGEKREYTMTGTGLKKWIPVNVVFTYDL
jgi:hypothetical protein